MQMIDVMKRLAELDSTNPTIVKESQQVEECGMMPEMGMGMGSPAMPASINMTAGSGEELSNMLATIMQLAGVKPHGAEEPMSAEPAVAIATEPEMDSNADMRSVMDLMNEPEAGDEDDGLAGLDRDHDGDHDMDDHNMEKEEGYYQDPDGDEDSAADQADQADHERRGREEEMGEYDNSPNSPIKPPMFNANQYANQENQPGQGNRMDGTSPKAYADMKEATADLFAQYKKFVSESNGMSQLEQKIRARLEKLHNEMEPEYAYEKVAREFGMDQEELQDKLAHGFGISEAYNPNSADATHSRDVNASHKADLKKKADAGDEGAKKRLAAMKDKEDTRRNDYNDRMERESVEEGKPSAGMSKGEKSSLAKKAAAGKDIGKPGKSFDKIASKAGGGEKGKKIAAAAMWKNAAKK